MTFGSVSEMLGTDTFVSPAEFASAAGMHKRTLMKKINRGELPSVLFGKRKVLIPTADLTEAHIEDVTAHAGRIATTRQTQSVYFIQAESGPIKIGIALDPGERLAGLQISHFEKLTLLAAVEGGIALETELHRRFARFKIRGEWFERCPEIEAEIARLRPKGG